jgi:hypothetical protein
MILFRRSPEQFHSDLFCRGNGKRAGYSTFTTTYMNDMRRNRNRQGPRPPPRPRPFVNEDQRRNDSDVDESNLEEVVHEQAADLEEEKKASDNDEVMSDMNFVYRSIIHTKFYRRDNGMVQFNQRKNFPRSNIATKSNSFSSENEAVVFIYNAYGKN